MLIPFMIAIFGVFNGVFYAGLCPSNGLSHPGTGAGVAKGEKQKGQYAYFLKVLHKKNLVLVTVDTDGLQITAR